MLFRGIHKTALCLHFFNVDARIYKCLVNSLNLCQHFQCNMLYIGEILYILWDNWFESSNVVKRSS